MSENRISIRITGAADVWACVTELRQVINIPLAAAAAAIKEHKPILLPWTTHPRDPYLLLSHRTELVTLLARLVAVGATAQILIDGEPFDRSGLEGRLVQAEADYTAMKLTHMDDPELFRMVSADGGSSLARKELARRLHNVDANELLWKADSSYAPSLRQELAREELARRGINLSNLRAAAGPCPHRKWMAGSDSYHECSCCSLPEKHDWKVSMDERGYGHGCSECGYFEQD